MLSGRLSGLVASQVMVELSPMRTLTGAAVQVMRGGAAAAISEGGAPTEEGGWVAEGVVTGWTSGAALTSMSSTPSPTWMSSNAVSTIAVELFLFTLSTIMSPRVRRGSEETSPRE